MQVPDLSSDSPALYFKEVSSSVTAILALSGINTLPQDQIKSQSYPHPSPASVLEILVDFDNSSCGPRVFFLPALSLPALMV